MTGLEPEQVRVAPGARRPRGNAPEVLVEFKILEIVVEELANVPGEVVMTVDQRHFLEQTSSEL